MSEVVISRSAARDFLDYLSQFHDKRSEKLTVAIAKAMAESDVKMRQARASLQGGEKCIWRETEEMWEADCGAAWTFNDGGPQENSMKHCHVCGKEIAVEACHARKEW